MELIIFLALVGIGAIILLIWALLSNREEKDDKGHTFAPSK